MLVINLGLCVVLAYQPVGRILFYALPETEHVSGQIELDNTEIVLTCTAEHSGGTTLSLKSCPVDNTVQCTEIDRVYDAGIPCDEYQLEMNASNIFSITTHSGYIVKTYNVDEIILNQK